MSVREHKRLTTARMLLAGDLREREAAEMLGLSPRQVRRLKRRVRAEGEAGVVHGLCGRPSARKMAEETGERIRLKYRELGGDWSVRHFADELPSLLGVEASREKLRRVLVEEPGRPRRGKRREHRRWRERRAREGELVQMDTSIHAWLEDRGPRLKLIAAIDDATGTLPWAEFFESEGVLENLTVVRRMVERKGLCASLYIDGAGHFFLDDKELAAARERGEEGLTQFGRVMKELGIETIHARSPQAKGRVERLFGTLQDRLVHELRLRGARDMAGANAYLRGGFLAKFNKRFGVTAATPGTMYVPLPKGFDYDAVFCLREERTIRNDYTISFNGRLLQLHRDRGHAFCAGRKVEARTHLDGSLHVFHGNKEVRFEPVGGGNVGAAG